MKNDHPSLLEVDHRPWKLPNNNWKWRQSWNNLVFIHYKIDIQSLRALVPSKFEIDLYQGEAWISIVPFFMEDVMKGNIPSFYPFKKFPELNLRTYVKYENKPGVFFFSLDAECLPVVLGGNLLYGVPYKYAKMNYELSENGGYLRSDRFIGSVEFEMRYRKIGEIFESEIGSLQEWLSERYCLYSKSNHTEFYRVEVHHKKWPLQNCEVSISKNDILKASNLEVDLDSMIVNYSPGVDVISFRPEKI